MRFIIFFGICGLIFLFFYLYVLPVVDKKNCIETDGIWHEGYCLKETTPDPVLKKLGLIYEERNENYQIIIEYPFEIAKYHKIHESLKEKFRRSVDEFKKRVEPEQNNNLNINVLKANCDPVKNIQDFGSVECRVISYFGKRNPDYSFHTITFKKNSQEILKLTDLFSDGVAALNGISDYVKNELYRIKSKIINEKVSEDEWIIGGTYPNEGNYSNYIINGSTEKIESIRIIFNPYQVGMFSEDYYNVIVPFGIFGEYLVQSEELPDE